MVQQTTRRAESPERWRAALYRAFAAGVEPLQVGHTDRWVVTSATRLATVYETDGVSCGCEAALAGDPICQHRAAVRFVLGRLGLDPEPAPSPRPLAKQYLHDRPHAA